MPHKYRIKPSRYEHNDPEVKAEMRKFIQQFEERLKKVVFRSYHSLQIILTCDPTRSCNTPRSTST